MCQDGKGITGKATVQESARKHKAVPDTRREKKLCEWMERGSTLNSGGKRRQ